MSACSSLMPSKLRALISFIVILFTSMTSSFQARKGSFSRAPPAFSFPPVLQRLSERARIVPGAPELPDGRVPFSSLSKALLKDLLKTSPGGEKSDSCVTGASRSMSTFEDLLLRKPMCPSRAESNFVAVLSPKVASRAAGSTERVRPRFRSMSAAEAMGLLLGRGAAAKAELLEAWVLSALSAASCLLSSLSSMARSAPSRTGCSSGSSCRASNTASRCIPCTSSSSGPSACASLPALASSPVPRLVTSGPSSPGGG
mmetsp:Transcript_102585/g.299272  ORF Transcript_102585/g.299272 Transcript_102585/m.299272 type:complete len:258 (-) Transcript_102585:676-1449(-)